MQNGSELSLISCAFTEFYKKPHPGSAKMLKFHQKLKSAVYFKVLHETKQDTSGYHKLLGKYDIMWGSALAHIMFICQQK